MSFRRCIYTVVEQAAIAGKPKITYIPVFHQNNIHHVKKSQPKAYQASRPAFQEALDRMLQPPYRSRACQKYCPELRALPTRCQERTGKPVLMNLPATNCFTYLAARRKHLSASTLNTVVCALKYYYREVARRLELVVDIPNPRKPKQRRLAQCRRTAPLSGAAQYEASPGTELLFEYQ